MKRCANIEILCYKKLIFLASFEFREILLPRSLRRWRAGALNTPKVFTQYAHRCSGHRGQRTSPCGKLPSPLLHLPYERLSMYDSIVSYVMYYSVTPYCFLSVCLSACGRVKSKFLSFFLAQNLLRSGLRLALEQDYDRLQTRQVLDFLMGAGLNRIESVDLETTNSQTLYTGIKQIFSAQNLVGDGLSKMTISQHSTQC